MVTVEKQEGQHTDSPREAEDTVDELAGTDKLLSQRESAEPTLRSGWSKGATLCPLVL